MLAPPTTEAVYLALNLEMSYPCGLWHQSHADWPMQCQRMFPEQSDGGLGMYKEADR